MKKLIKWFDGFDWDAAVGKYGALQSALDAHLAKALQHYHLTKEGKVVYENAVAACKSILSKTIVKEERG